MFVIPLRHNGAQKIAPGLKALNVREMETVFLIKNNKVNGLAQEIDG